MEGWFRWVAENWFNLVQGTGIVLGLFYTGIALRRDAASRRVGNLMALAVQHRDLWSELHRRPDLQRVLDPNPDLIAQPVSTAEGEFLNLVIIHFGLGWELATRHGLISAPSYAADVTDFFSLPLPRLVWEQTRKVRDPAFVRFVNHRLRPRT